MHTVDEYRNDFGPYQGDSVEPRAERDVTALGDVQRHGGDEQERRQQVTQRQLEERKHLGETKERTQRRH